MKKVIRFRARIGAFFSAALLAGLSMACDRDPPPPLPGQVAQPATAVMAAGKLFVASPPADALYVLDLGDEGFVRAPNPLFALEVPAVRRPTILHAVPASDESERDLVLALSSVDRQMRVIDAEEMVPLGRPVELPGLPVALDILPGIGGVLVAVEAPEGTSDPGGYFFSLLSPAVRQRGGEVGEDDPPVLYKETDSLGFRPGGLAVTEHEDATFFWFSDLASSRVSRVEPFTAVDDVATGRALTSLVSSPDASNDSEYLPQGRFVYGLTDDYRGLLALDGFTGEVVGTQVVDGLVQPMDLPAAGVALTVVPRAMIDIGTEEDRRPVLFPYLVLVALIDGRILYVDGTKMIPVDIEGRQVPEPWFTTDPSVNLTDADGAYSWDLDRTAPILAVEDNPDYETGGDMAPLMPSVDLTAGITRSRTWRVSWRAEIPSASPALGTIIEQEGQVFVEPTAAPAGLTQQVVAGDRLYIRPAAIAETEGCEAYSAFSSLVWAVSSVEESAAMALETVDDGPPLPSTECFAGELVYRLRAGGYTVRGDRIDEVFRLEPGETFEYEGERFLRTTPIQEGPEIRFTLAETQYEEELIEGAERRLIVRAGFEMVAATPDVSGLQLARATMVGRPAVNREETERFGGGRVFVPYAGPGYLISFDLRSRGEQRAHR